jgi:hypothetical protein
MKNFEYKTIPKEEAVEGLSLLGAEGWELCATIDTNMNWIFKREISDKMVNIIGLLVSCSYMRGVSTLQHRTIGELNQFVDSVMKGEMPKYEFDWNSHDAIETWIMKFHDYCKETYENSTLETDTHHE